MLTSMICQFEASDQDTELYAAFRQFDPDKDGNIDGKEIETMLRATASLDLVEIDEFMRTFAGQVNTQTLSCVSDRDIFHFVPFTLLPTSQKS